MKAAVYKKYGPSEVLQIKEVEKPTPGPGEIVVKVYVTTVTFGDTMARNLRNVSYRDFNMPYVFLVLARLTLGFRSPKKQILGSEFAGIVEATGENVERFQKGDQVFGYTGPGFGACAEYLCISEKTSSATMLANTLVEVKPSNLTFEEAASLPYGFITAWNLLKKAELSNGKKILINGASGSIGSAAVQIAKNYYGAEVTGVCSTAGVQYVKAMGAEYVIDYTQEDFTQNADKYDVVFDVLGRSTFAKCKKVLKNNGRYLLASFKTEKLIQMLWTSAFSNKKVICALSLEKPDDLAVIKKLAEEGKIKPVIDRQFPLERIAEAHDYAENGHRKGSIIIHIRGYESDNAAVISKTSVEPIEP